MKEGLAPAKRRLLDRLPSYPDWLISSHRLLLVRWAQLHILVMCASMLHPMGRLLVYRLYAIGFIISSLGITSSASTAVAYKKVQFWFAAFSLLQFMVVCQMAYIGAAPAVHSYLDWATNLSTLVPQMLVLDLSSVKLAFFLLAHAGAETAFYLSVVAHSLPVAVLRATCLYSVVAVVFLKFRRQAYAAYLCYRSQNLPPKHTRTTLPSKKQECMEVRHQVQQEAPLIPPPPPIHTYRSRMRRKRITVTIDTPLMLSQVPEESIKDLLYELGSCWKGHVTDVCVRSGCIVVSLNVWGPLRAVGGLAQQPLADLRRALIDVAGAWATRHNLGSADSLTPRVSVQVSDLISSVTTDPSTHGLPDAAAAFPVPDPASGPSLPLCALSMPTPALLLPPIEQANQQQGFSRPATRGTVSASSSPSTGAPMQSKHAAEDAAPMQHKHAAEEALTAAPARTARIELPFEVFICPSADLGDIEVLGWEKQEDSPEEDGQGCVRLLASVASQFMPVRVLHHHKQGPRHAVQVSMSLPASMATANFAGCLSLELWGARMLMCCHTTLLLPHTCAPVCKELQDWAVSLSKQQQQQQQQLDSWPQHHSLGSSHFGNGQLSMPAGASDVGGYQAFANDLGEWLQVIGQWQKGDAECRLGAAAGAGTEGELNDATGSSLILDGEDELQVMAAVGKDLLFTSVRTGMASLAGMLLKCLMLPPFSLPFASLVTHIPEPPESAPELAPYTHSSAPSTTACSSSVVLDGNTPHEITHLGPKHAENLGAPGTAHSLRSVISSVSINSSGGEHSDIGVCKCKVMLVEAALSGSVAMLEQVLAWGRSLGERGFAWPWGASDCSASALMEVLGADASKREVVQVLLRDVEGAKCQGPITLTQAPEEAPAAAPAAAALAGATTAAVSSSAMAAATAIVSAGKAAAAVSTAAKAATAAGMAASTTGATAASTVTAAGVKVSQTASAVAAATLGLEVKEKERAQQKWCQVRQAEYSMLSTNPAHHLPSYSVWLLARYRKLITQWALLFCVIVLSHVVHPVAAPVTETVYLNFSMMMMLAAAGVAVASQRGAYSMVKLCMFSFWLFQVLTSLQLCMAGAAPAVHKYLDLGTNLVTAVPYMLVLEMPISALSLFMAVTLGTAIYFYTKVVGHSLLLAIVRAGCVHGVCLVAFITIRRNMRENYFKEMERAKQCSPPLERRCDAS